MTTTKPNILVKTEAHVLSLFNEKGGSTLLFHNFKRAREITQKIQDIGAYTGLNIASTEIEIAKLSAWFISLGKLLNFNTPLAISKSSAVSFLQSQEYPSDKITLVINCIDDVTVHPSNTTTSQLVHDSVLTYWSTSNYLQLVPLIKLEEELILNIKYDIQTWEEKQLKDLMLSKFYTAYGQLVFSPILNQNILEQKKRSENILLKLKGKKATEDRLFRKYQGLEPKLPQRGIQTYFRAIYQNHIQLSAIADNKANMMTGINTILVSVVISIITYSKITYEIPQTVMPLAIFLLTALVSLIFSVLSATPRVTRKNKKGDHITAARNNIAYFGNFAHLELEEFEQAIDAMLRNDELLYGNMSRDLYFLGKALDTKYKLLRISYYVFLGGFILSVLLFTIIAFGLN